jgi:hypothetical protein
LRFSMSDADHAISPHTGQAVDSQIPTPV